MQMDYPDNPAYGQLYRSGSFTWIWDGQKWASGLGAPVTSVAGRTGDVVLTHSDITDWATATPFLPLAGGTLTGPLLISASGDPGQSTAHAGFTSTRWRFAVIAGADPAGGTIDYRGYDSNAVSIVGAGASAPNRLVHIFDNLTVGNVTSGAITSGAISATGTINASSDISTPGNVKGTNSVQSNGVYFQNNSGWFYTPQNFLSGAAIAVSGNTGFYWTYNGGWMYSPNSVNAAGNIQANAGVIVGNSNLVFNSLGQTMYPPGDGWLYFNGSFRVVDFQSSNNVNAAGVVYINGMYWQNNGGWMYTPWQINTGGGINCNGNVQCNGNNVYGQNFMANGCAYGGWGIQSNWTGNGYWVSFQATDAFYVYNNQGLAGGIYWTYCDERMKSNFRPVTRDCLAAINTIELKAFDFSEGAPRQRRTNPYETRSSEHFLYEELPRIVKHIETGFIAQQLREVIPEAVPDPLDESSYLSVDMRPMVATLIGAVQQLTARLAVLEGR